MKRILIFASLFFLSLCFPLRAENELFPFVISFDAPKNVTNISDKLDAPAGRHGFVRVKDGHFVTDKGRIQFWGTNTCFAANFLTKEQSDRMADRMARFGINCVRLHHMDMRDIWGKNYSRTQMEFDPDQLDRLDYYIAALKKRGIYVNINLHVSRSLDERDGFPPNANRPSHDKGIDNYYRPFIEANKKFAKDLLEHVNPYTGKAYKDEPAVAMIEINNENSIACMWGGWGGLDVIQDPFLADLRKLWNNWLVKKYKNDEGLKKAWRARTEPMGDELLKNGDFPKGYVPNYQGWNWEIDEQVDAPMSNSDGILKLDVRKKGKVDWHPQLIGSSFAVKAGKLYTLRAKVRASRAVPMNFGVRMNHDPWDGLGFDTTAQLTPAWQEFSFVFMPSKDDDNARLSVGGFREGTVYEFESISLKSGGKVGLPAEPVFGAELLKNGEFDKNYVPDHKGWSWETDSAVDATVTNENGVLKLDVRKKGEVDWHPQLNGGPIAVEGGKKYTLTVTARANKRATAHLDLRMNHDPWDGLGFGESIELSTDWKTFTFTVTPSESDKNARITFGGLNADTVYEIDAISIKPGRSRPGVESSLARGTVPVLWKKEAGKHPKEAVDDFCDFILDVETKYWDEMYRYLKDEIKVKQPVSGTQLQYGSTHAQAKMDYCDIHAYWNHPHFPGRAWDGNNWYLHNRALVNYADRSIFGPLATSRVYGKPFTVSEYNHPYPNQFAGEGLPLLAAFGAFQGWDGIFPFAYSHSNDPEPQRATSFFDTSGNTVQMAHMIACHMLFCDGYNKDADKNMLVAPMSLEKEREIFREKRHVYAFDFSGLGLDRRLALLKPVAVDVSGKIKNMPKVDEIPKDQKIFAVKRHAIDRFQYDMQTSGKGWVGMCSPMGGTLFTGFVEEGKAYPLLDGDIRFGKTNLGWATVSLAVVDKKKMLLVATGEMLNTDMKIEQLDGDKITVGNRWGRAPVRCEGIPATITLPNGNMKCWALDESGNRKQEVPVKKTDKEIVLELKPEYKTIWYELEGTK